MLNKIRKYFPFIKREMIFEWLYQRIFKAEMQLLLGVTVII